MTAWAASWAASQVGGSNDRGACILELAAKATGRAAQAHQALDDGLVAAHIGKGLLNLRRVDHLKRDFLQQQSPRWTKAQSCPLGTSPIQKRTVAVQAGPPGPCMCSVSRPAAAAGAMQWQLWQAGGRRVERGPLGQEAAPCVQGASGGSSSAAATLAPPQRGPLA